MTDEKGIPTSEDRVKFSAKNGDAKIDIGSEKVQCGLSKDELMKFANDPFWVALRKILFVLFWLLWLAMLLGAIAIIIITPRCAKPKEPEWYEKSPIYTIRVDQYHDSDGDGIGDLAGIISKLNYLNDDIYISTIALEGLLDKNNLTRLTYGIGSMSDFQKLASKIKVLVKIPLINEILERSDEMDVILRKWIENGASGFIFEEFNMGLRDIDSNLERWRAVANNATTGDPIALLLSEQNFDNLPYSYCSSVDMLLNYEILKLPSKFGSFGSTELYALLEDVKEKNVTCRHNFVIGTAVVSGLAQMFSPPTTVESVLMFSMLADATPIVYYGDEYGKKDSSGEVKPRTLSNIPDANTGKMDWDDVMRIKSQPDNSLFKVFQRVSKLRRDEVAIRQGDTILRQVDSATVLTMIRIKKGYPGFIVVGNFKLGSTTINLRKSVSKFIPASGNVAVTTTNSKKGKDAKVELDSLHLEPLETVVIQFVPEAVDEAAEGAH